MDSEELEYQDGLNWTEVYTIFIMKLKLTENSVAQTTVIQHESVQVCSESGEIHEPHRPHQHTLAENRKHIARKQILKFYAISVKKKVKYYEVRNFKAIQLKSK